MGTSKDDVLKNRSAILNSANALFREKGPDAVGVTELMKRAGFTQGGFYNHFSSKDALVNDVVAMAMDTGLQDLEKQLGSGDDLSTVTGQVEFYLSPEHRDDIEHGCPISGLAHDVRRMGDEAQATFAKGLRAAIEEVRKHLGDDVDEGGAAAIYSQLVGGLILARATAASDPELSETLMEASREAASWQVVGLSNSA
ncbi:TetR/AcrR family transcriptional regulator [Pararhizobium sp. LjRoot238]|uniref:TetR/AcrR family transcriptional regulator n=1 Tax=Pararhizobium sp. LjRoot238 TaxID=3342293 RepID=UPI003ECE3CF8